MLAAGAAAIDYLPFDYVPAPAGTNAVLGYYLFGTRSSFHSTLTGTTDEGTRLQSHIGAVRMTRYEELLGQPAAVQVILPFGALTEGRIAGFDLNEPVGMFDPLLTLAFWPINQPQARRWLAIASYTSFPLGQYTPGQALNLGGNRFQHDLQVGLIQGLPGGFTLDLALDWINYTDNDRAGTGRQTLAQQQTLELYAWLAYNLTEGSYLAVGYAGALGGTQRLDGAINGIKTEFHQVRAAYGHFLTPSFQVTAQVGRDVEVRGGFKQDLAITLRVLKVF